MVRRAGGPLPVADPAQARVNRGAMATWHARSSQGRTAIAQSAARLASRGMVVMSQIAGPPHQPVPSPSVPSAAHRAWWRHPVLIIPLAVVVTAAVAAAVFLALRPTTITAS